MGASLLFIFAAIFQSAPLGLVGLGLFLFGALVCVLACPWFGKGFYARFVFGGPALLFLPTCLLLVIYFAGGSFSWGLAFGVFVVSSAVFMGLPQDKLCLPSWKNEEMLSVVWFGLSMFGSMLLIALFVAGRTGDAIISPWNYYAGQQFVLFGLSAAFFFLGARKAVTDLWLVPGVLLVFSALSVSAIMYKVGFGFDPFLHRAAEEALISEGVVYPKQFLYSAQYLFVASVSSLASVAVKWVDIWFVPVSASVWLPVATFYGLYKGWGMRRRAAMLFWLLAFVIPYQLLTFTVPFTITFILFVGAIFLFPLVIKDVRNAGLLFVYLLVSCFYHPLLTAPVLALLVSVLLWHATKTKVPEWIFLIVGGISTALSVPVLLMVYFYQTGQSVVFSSLVQNAVYFTSLWTSPYWDPFPYIPWFLNFIYDLRYMLPFVFAIIALGYIVRHSAKQSTQWFFVFWVGLLVAIYGTSTLFQFKNIISHEQQEFALRLAHAWFVASLPLVAVVAGRFSRLPVVHWCLSGLVVLVLVHAWHFSYPQYNMKYLFYSPGVSEEDVSTVQLIDEDAKGASYLVLSNQMVSAAAIQEFGFAHYYPLQGEEVLWYAIPTGGPLYENYVVLLDGGFTQQRCDDLSRETHVDQLYVVVPSYYAYTIPTVLDEIEQMSEWKKEQQEMIIYKLICPL